MKLKITIVGECDEGRLARSSIVPALGHAALAIGKKISCRWLASEQVDDKILRESHGIFVAPGSPFEEVKGILDAIHFARTQEVPCLGTCGGFQRIVMEFAARELGLESIAHQELEPDAVDPFFSAMKCSLVGEEAVVNLIDNTFVSGIYGTNSVKEYFYCGYGIGNSYLPILEKSELAVSGFDTNGEARVVELTNHPFFVGTLFVPQVNSSHDSPHPLLVAFVKAISSGAS
ncbi:hypothetical protein MLD52_13415 [Puniceicoccaceae bacterium K14]|nr:hypothetical protein [Puniceicoccaceae bacterium K14]